MPPTVRASVSTARVLATPGTPSSRQWPRASRPTIDPLDHPLLADDHPLDLEQHPLERRGVGGRRVLAIGLGHVYSVSRGGPAEAPSGRFTVRDDRPLTTCTVPGCPSRVPDEDRRAARPTAAGPRRPSTCQWRNPRLHDAARVKHWLACDEHADDLADFLARRGFLLDRGPLASQQD